MNKNHDHVFDDTFRTMEEHAPELMIPLINEVFHTTYPENAEISKQGDKHHLMLQTLETDSYLRIRDKAYHFECESNPGNGIIAIRMFQYDVTVAIEQKYRKDGVYIVEFPSSCVIYLRHNSNTKDEELVVIRMPDGRELDYRVPVIKSQFLPK